MKKIFLNVDQRVRNGWWILLFLILFLASRFVYTPLSQGLGQLGVSGEFLEPLRFGLVVLVTWACTRLRGEPLSSVGFRLDRRWFAQFVAGVLIGTVAMLAIVGLIWTAGGVRLEMDPQRSAGTLLYGLYLFLFVALFEETLFRGFVFQRLVDGTGVWFAQLMLAMLFAVGHWGNPGMQGATEVVAMLDLSLGAIFLGLAYLRTRSLALPVGLHLGWNWAQGHLLGFGVSGFEYTGWFKPLLQGMPQWLTGGEFGPESSVFAIGVDLVLIFILWRWKGSPDQPGQVSLTKTATVVASRG